MIANSIQFHPVLSLDDGILPLVTEADDDGHRFMRRLLDDWESGANRFQGDGEFLLGGYIDGRLIGIGGLNKDPYTPAAHVGRLRHVYIAEASRRQRLGTILVRRIMNDASRTFGTLRLRTTTPEAAAFYERLGFRKVNDETATHVLEGRSGQHPAPIFR